MLVLAKIGEKLKLEGETENGRLNEGAEGHDSRGTVYIQGLSALGLCQIDHRSDTVGDPFADR